MEIHGHVNGYWLRFIEHHMAVLVTMILPARIIHYCNKSLQVTVMVGCVVPDFNKLLHYTQSSWSYTV